MEHVELEYRLLIKLQYSTVQYSTVQYSTVQYSTVQYSTVPLYKERSAITYYSFLTYDQYA